ncbi:hypothetical protein BDR04DRAFT_1123576, partial [Suillus decipiens]
MTMLHVLERVDQTCPAYAAESTERRGKLSNTISVAPSYGRSGREEDIQPNDGVEKRQPERRRHAVPTSDAIGDIAMRKNDVMQGSSEEVKEGTTQADKTSDGPDNRLSTHTRYPEAREEAIAQERAKAMEQFQDFSKDWCLDKYEATLTSHFSAEHSKSIDFYVEAIKHLGTSTPEQSFADYFKHSSIDLLQSRRKRRLEEGSMRSCD